LHNKFGDPSSIGEWEETILERMRVSYLHSSHLF
jgi:hypothetical protein